MTKQIVSPVIKVAFPAIWSPEERKDKPEDQWKYSVIGIVEPDNAQAKAFFTQLKSLIDTAVADGFGANPPHMPHKTVKDCSDPSPISGKIPATDYGYGEGKFFKATSKFQPAVTNLANQKGMVEADQEFYGGCYCRLLLSAGTYPARDGGAAGVSLYLNGIQFVKDGEKMGGDSSESAINAFAENALSTDELADIGGAFGEEPEAEIDGGLADF